MIIQDTTTVRRCFCILLAAVPWQCSHFSRGWARGGRRKQESVYVCLSGSDLQSVPFTKATRVFRPLTNTDLFCLESLGNEQVL